MYTGVTNDLEQRLIEHYLTSKTRNTEKFTARYFCYNLLYFEKFQWIEEAIAREKEIKGWFRAKKLELIMTENPQLRFLNHEVCFKWPPQEDATIRNT